VLNSDSASYGGSNQGNAGGVNAENSKLHRQPHSAEFKLAPMSVMVFKVDQ
jgi:1,4-alpha-glucan branching enzyme